MRRKPPPPLAVTFAPSAERAIEQAADWLATVSSAASQRFARRLKAEVDELARETARWLAQDNAASTIQRPTLDEGASLQFSQPVYRYPFQTGAVRRGRRDSAGRWNVFYALADRDHDGRIDTVQIVTVRHAASRPFPHFEDSENGEE